MRRQSSKRQWDPKTLGGCVLHLPFYKYDKAQKMIYDQSGYGNHGTITGATPTYYPITSGVELVTNGGMEAGEPPTGWSAINTPEVFESSGVQKHSGAKSAHINDSIASNGGIQHSVSFVSGKTYKLSFYYYIVSGSISGWSNDGFIVTGPLTTTGSWQFAEAYGVLGAGSIIVINNYSVSVAAEFYIDDVSVQKVISTEQIGWGFDGVDDVVTVADANSLSFTNNIFTFLVWYRPNNPVGLDILGKTGTGYEYAISRYLENQIRMNAWKSDGGADVYQSTMITVAPFKWNCIAYVADGSTLQAYLNAVAGNSNVKQASDMTNTTNPLVIGKYSTNYGKIGLGEVLIFNRALSSQEIKAYYENTRSHYNV